MRKIVRFMCCISVCGLFLSGCGGNDTINEHVRLSSQDDEIEQSKEIDESETTDFVNEEDDVDVLKNVSGEEVPEEENVDETETDTSSPTDEISEDIRPEFKEALDSYETYMDEYCEFMKKYNDSNSDPSMLSEYLEMMKKYTEFVEKIDALGDEEMNDAEAKYYAEVTLRVSQKLLEVL